MANGKPGDNPINDIVLYHKVVFGPPIDQLIVEIVRLGGRNQLEEKYQLYSPPSLEKLSSSLKAFRDKLLTDARKRGWELDDFQEGNGSIPPRTT